MRFAWDPAKSGQTSDSLQSCLIDEELGMNAIGWNDPASIPRGLLVGKLFVIFTKLTKLHKKFPGGILS